ncbi:MAG TPA: L-ribulose-5-phosphate 4-epimerase AraD [Acidimicrobiia bacterium]|nr:L-ribulose-5-phosphate 4-epimerase AraD [Acidimicrobiia bacterium]
MTGGHSQLRGAVALANNAIAEAGLVVHAFGNASQVDRTAGVFAIKPSGIPCRQVTGDDIVVISLDDGEVVWGDNRPSSDTPTHRAIYNGIDTAGGVVHTHSIYATAWAQARLSIPCLGTTHADHFRGPVPVTRPLSTEEVAGDYEANTGRVIVEMYQTGGLRPDESPGALVASHGPFAWGEDATAAVEMAAAIELVAELASHTLAIRSDQPALEDHLLDRHFGRKHGPMAYYGQP